VKGCVISRCDPDFCREKQSQENPSLAKRGEGRFSDKKLSTSRQGDKRAERSIYPSFLQRHSKSSVGIGASMRRRNGFLREQGTGGICQQGRSRKNWNTPVRRLESDTIHSWQDKKRNRFAYEQAVHCRQGKEEKH
jgi:hypothetical protein